MLIMKKFKNKLLE